ncbi:MAG: hypothetical protein ACTHJJ_04730 [Intrasporangium sp.]|uniref:hypothetical protein n=1 Tax=Intrasporangium sp. TaxID=1925024 RepID=UPI003F81BE33
MIRRHPIKSLVVALTLVVVALAWAYVARPTVPVPPTQAPQPGQSLVVVGVGGVSWDDVSVSDTPILWGLLRDGSAASVSVKALHLTTCPTDGWATLGAGEAAGVASSADRPDCGPLPEVTGTAATGWQVAGFDAIARSSADGPYDAHLGLLGDSFARAGTCVQAVGPGAALAAATSNGRVASYSPFSVTTLTSDLAQCPVSLVDVGALLQTDPDHVRQVERLNSLERRISQVVDAAPNGADIVVVGLSDRDRQERLRVLAASGPHYPPGLLASASTRLTGIAQLSDVSATILARGGATPVQEIGGRALSVIPSPNNSESTAASKLTVLTDLDTKADAKQAIEVPFLLLWLVTAFVLFVALGIAWRRARPWSVVTTRLRVARWAAVVGLVSAAMPAATFLANLVPWWRVSGETWVLVAVFTALVLAMAVILAAIAVQGPWGSSALGPVATLSAITAAVIGVDLITGSHLQIGSIFGLQPLVGGRFYGMGNVAFALYGAGVLVLCAALAHGLRRRGAPRLAIAVVAVISIVALAVDVLPAWGADFGGPLALVPALGILLLSVSGLRTSIRSLVLVGFAAVLVVGVVSFVDWLRPPAERAHPGRFVQSLIDGGAWPIISRKFFANIELGLAMPVLFALVTLALIPFILIAFRPGLLGTGTFGRLCEEAPLLRVGLIGVVVMAVIGFLTNDSGIAIPPVAAIFVVPGIIAATAHFTIIEERRKPVKRRSDRHIL